jgi:cyclophilin family peptidyl-prolyl cis-trans isomerase
MESRVLLSGAPQIVDAVADNRGQVVLTVNQALDPATVNTSSVFIYTAGANGILGTADDIQQTATVNYDAATDQIVATANVPAGTPYRVDVLGSVVAGAGGSPNLDGEFNGANVPSGNGTPGGDYQFETTTLAQPVAIFSTVEGTMDVPLFASQTPVTVANFEAYANAGDWDGTFFHRNIPGAIAQGGGYNVSASDQIGTVPALPPIVNESGIPNTLGTIAMARTTDPNSATNEWFFNLADNSSELDTPPNNYAVFGQIADANSLAVMNAIGSLPVYDATGGDPNSPFGDLPLVNYTPGNDIDPLTNLALVQRVAMEAGITALPEPTRAALVFVALAAMLPRPRRDVERVCSVAKMRDRSQGGQPEGE